MWDDDPKLKFDINGDGRKDIVVAGQFVDKLVAYDLKDGSLILKIAGDDTYFKAAFGDLDGKPGDEIALFIERYGLVILGRKS